MSWFKKLFGGSEPAPPPVVTELPRVRQTKTKTHTPISVARKIAKAVPGAEVEDFGEQPRDDCLLARVTYVHEGVEARLVINSTPDEPDVHSAVWLDTKCTGVFGSFDVNYVRPGQTFAEDEPLVPDVRLLRVG